ncbi:MAG: hypothetical protein LBB75_09710 [Oscillospiraceae bacterium]|jgi:hypothetical protein|nr:hypothetical protein [Oscillospiraceae bacterium]
MARNIFKVKRNPKVLKTYRQSIPATRFIGKKYGDEDRIDGHGGFGKQWEAWHENGWFKLLEESCPKADFEDADAHIGLMRWRGEKDEEDYEPFQYWVGMFFAEGAEVPEGFDFVDFPASDLGVGWLYGKDSYLFGKEHLVFGGFEKQGIKVIPDRQDAHWFFERYACPRNTTPDKRGKKILDIAWFAEKEGEVKKVRVCKKCSGFDVAELAGLLAPEEYTTYCIGHCLSKHPELKGKAYGLINDELAVCDTKEEFLAKVREAN